MSRRDGPPRNQAGQDLETGVRLDAAPRHAPPRSARYTLLNCCERKKRPVTAVMARRAILAAAAGLLLLLGVAHVYLHPTLQPTAHEDDTIARLEKLHATLSEKTSMQEKALASYKAPQKRPRTP